MRLTADKVLDSVASSLGDQVAPQVEGDPFLKETIRRAQALIAIVSLAGDDAAAIRVAENARMREIFGKAAGVADDARYAEAAASRDPGLKISELDAETGRLRTLLVELHARLEDMDGVEAKALDREIWLALRDFEMARAPRA